MEGVLEDTAQFPQPLQHELGGQGQQVQDPRSWNGNGKKREQVRLLSCCFSVIFCLYAPATPQWKVLRSCISGNSPA